MERTERVVNFVYLLFLAAAILLIQGMIGGTRLLFSLPSYLVLAGACVLTAVSMRRRKVAPDVFCLLSTLLLGVYVLARSAHSPVDYLARQDFFMMLGCLMVYGLTAFYLTKTPHRQALLVVLFVIAIVEVSVGAVQFSQGNGYMLFGFIRGDVTKRASGMFISPNHFAGYLEAVALFALSHAVWSRWRLWAKIIAGYLAIFCWLGVAISGSRGGYFTTMLSLAAFIALSLYVVKITAPAKFLPVALALIVTAVAVIGLAAFLMLHSPLLTDRIHRMTAHDVRIYNWAAALDQFRLAPTFGTGAGTHLIYGRQFRRPAIQMDPVHAHCDYLEMLAEYGIVGVVLLLVFVYAHFRNGLRSFVFLLRNRLLVSPQFGSDSFALQVGALCALTALAVHSVVDFNMHIPGNALVYAFFFGIAASPTAGRQMVSAARIAPWFRLALPALGVYTAIAAIPKLSPEYCARIALRNDQYFRSVEYARNALGAVSAKPVGVEWFIQRFGGDRQNPAPYFYIGEANRVLGLSSISASARKNYYRHALDAYRRGLAWFPQDENMLVRMAQTLDGLRLYDEAEEAYRKALLADPNLGLIYGYYGTHLRAMGLEKEAAEAYRHGAELVSSSVEQIGRKELGL